MPATIAISDNAILEVADDGVRIIENGAEKAYQSLTYPRSVEQFMVEYLTKGKLGSLTS